MSILSVADLWTRLCLVRMISDVPNAADGGRSPAKRIGIMQGRLLPPVSAGRIQAFPRDGWATEFELAALAGLGAIELSYDTWGENVNPIATDVGVRMVRNVVRDSGVQVRSLV